MNCLIQPCGTMGKCLIACIALLASIAGMPCAAQGNVSGPGVPPVSWVGGFGIASPFIVTVSGGALVPLAPRAESQRKGFPGVPALRADVDLGLGGGMVSAGISAPTLAGTPQESEIILKGAVLRTWLLDTGPGKDKTYRGIVTEMVAPNSFFASAKFGLGYFRRSEPGGNRHVLYAFFGLGFS